MRVHLGPATDMGTYSKIGMSSCTVSGTHLRCITNVHDAPMWRMKSFHTVFNNLGMECWSKWVLSLYIIVSQYPGARLRRVIWEGGDVSCN